jgi:hypothetical protein
MNKYNGDVYLTSLCSTCDEKFEKGDFCHVCLKVETMSECEKCKCKHHAECGCVPVEAGMELDEWDEREVERKERVLQLKKRRGRPKKVREEVDIGDEEREIKGRDVLVFRGMRVVVPHMRNMYGWFKW